MLFFNLILFTFVVSSWCKFPNVYPKLKSYQHAPDPDDPGAPLFLTPLINSGKISEAQNAAKVDWIGFKNTTSYAGYLTVNEKTNSNLFFWFFPALNDFENAPVILWLQGGPGATSLIGLFTENGPFVIKTKHGVKLRKYSWHLYHSVIYIDNPVGTGYSFTDKDEGYAQNETAVGEDLYNALVQFFKLFPNLQKNPFFVTGESYAGKYVPAFSYTIHTKNPSAGLKINLQGLAMGNGLSDPGNQLLYGDYLYQLGLVDSNGRDYFHKVEDQCRAFIKGGNWIEAFETFDNLLNGDTINGSSLFSNITGFHFYFNYLHSEDYDSMDMMSSYVQKNYIRKAIHVGNKTFNVETSKVEDHLKQDVMQSVAPWIIQLLANYRVLIYNGQLDIIVAYPLTVNYLKNLNFNGANEYKTAPRKLWYVDSELAGYVKTAGNLTEVLVRNAGHMVPTDQPKWALDLISRFVANKPFVTEE
ncbi:venom serine carboxypeptidase [Chrysoperla carnea]|uniref:venom serine carboxypeptidase n=1 Tax=Chrysoperla carnea TaxID=189513 RepID=UPI001D068E47|nr:venom serine carboxypeptidase [Chrysoperla carnea]